MSTDVPQTGSGPGGTSQPEDCPAICELDSLLQDWLNNNGVDCTDPQNDAEQLACQWKEDVEDLIDQKNCDCNDGEGS